MQNAEPTNYGLEDQPSLGEIKINHSVIASIVRLAALRVPGVSAVGAGLVDGIAELFSKRESDRGVKIDEDDRGNYVIEVRVVIFYGTEIGKTAYQVQMAVREQVAHMTGKSVARVDVVIDGVKQPTEEKPAADHDEWPSIPATD
jgi:uncharacterized alkaline shock family protein YloU